MSLELSPMTEADIPTYVTLTFAAFEDGILTPLMWPNGLSAQDIEILTAQNRELLLNDKNMVLEKVTDTSTDTIIACAQWNRTPARTPEEVAKPPDLPPWAPGANAAVKNHFIGEFFHTRDEIMGGAPHWVLSILVALPEHHRRGAGSMLLKRGLERADEDGWDSYLEASPKGKGLYEKYGFGTVKRMDIDLGPWGKEGEWLRNTLMVRKAKESMESKNHES